MKKSQALLLSAVLLLVVFVLGLWFQAHRLLPSEKLHEILIQKVQGFTEGTLKYQGIVEINKHKCHKIRSDIKNNTGGTHVIYWVEEKTGMLYLMADYQNKAYNVYWINKVGKVPAKTNFSIYLPAKQLSEYHGYTIIDNRFNGSF